jgi:hypothetical protein
MAIEFSKTFGAGAPTSGAAANTSGAGSRSDAPKAKIWLNVGYVAEGAGENGEDRFVSLPVGIPLDTQDRVQTNTRNADYNDFQAARNDLLDQLLAVATGLEPGEDAVLNLQIQMRRVSEERQSTTVTEGNKFARPASLSLVA